MPMRKPVTVEFRDDVSQFLLAEREFRMVNGNYYRKMILATLTSLLTDTVCLINMDSSWDQNSLSFGGQTINRLVT